MKSLTCPGNRCSDETLLSLWWTLSLHRGVPWSLSWSSLLTCCRQHCRMQARHADASLQTATCFLHCGCICMWGSPLVCMSKGKQSDMRRWGPCHKVSLAKVLKLTPWDHRLRWGLPQQQKVCVLFTLCYAEKQNLSKATSSGSFPGTAYTQHRDGVHTGEVVL